MHKYNAKRTEVKLGKEVYSFPSKKEANRFIVLVQLQRMGKIDGLTLQPEFLLQPDFECDGQTIRPIKYIADFSYVDTSTGEKIIEDCKGVETDVFKLKKKLFLYRYPELKLKIT